MDAAAASDMPKCFTLPGGDQFFHSTGNVFNGHLRIDPMLIEPNQWLSAHSSEGI